MNGDAHPEEAPLPVPAGQERARRTARLVLAGCALLLAVPVTLGLLNRDGGQGPPTSSGDGRVAAGGPFSAAYDAICGAAPKAAADPDGTHRVFMNEIHGPLHDLVAGVDDRAVSGRLLRTKAAVESTGDHETLPTRLAVLARATRRAITATGADDPGPCP